MCIKTKLSANPQETGFVPPAYLGKSFSWGGLSKLFLYRYLCYQTHDGAIAVILGSPEVGSLPLFAGSHVHSACATQQHAQQHVDKITVHSRFGTVACKGQSSLNFSFLACLVWGWRLSTKNSTPENWKVRMGSWSVYWTVDDSLTRLVEYEYNGKIMVWERN